MSNDLLRATCPPEFLPEMDRLEAEAKAIARRLPWTDDDFNALTEIHRQMVSLSIAPARETAA